MKLPFSSYTVISLAPVGIAALLGYLVAKAITPHPIGIFAEGMLVVAPRDLVVAAVLGLLAAGFGIMLMRGIAICESLLVRMKIRPALGPTLGGLIVGLLALISSQVMSSGHGALHLAGVLHRPLKELAGDLWLTGVVLIAVIISAQVTRETFGYSSATWRFHLRGETIRSAADVGWMRDLTVRQMMQRGVPTASVDLLVSMFCQAFPLGSAKQVATIDAEGRYAELVLVSEAHETEDQTTPIEQLLQHVDDTLLPEMNIKQAVRVFDRTEAEALVVVNSHAERRVIGLLTEAHALRRYTDALELRQREKE